MFFSTNPQREIDYRLTRVADILLLNASFIDNLGLLHGKMGITICFFQFAAKTQNKVYEKFAVELIEEIYDEIDNRIPLDFENGLAGIGWGIEHLVSKGFIDANTDEVLEEFDSRLLLSKGQLQELYFINDLIGIGYYYLKRLQNPSSSNEKKIVNMQMLIRLIDEIELRINKQEVENFFLTSNFNLLWDYPQLLLFLSEVHKLNHLNPKAKSILIFLINQLTIISHTPLPSITKLHLAWTFAKIKNIKIEIPHLNIDKLINNLLSNLNKESIYNELKPVSASLKNGTSGVGMIYNDLYNLTKNVFFKNEALYWIDKSFEISLNDNQLFGINIETKDEAKIFGRLEGLAGLI